jgi:hypothetical protein
MIGEKGIMINHPAQHVSRTAQRNERSENELVGLVQGKLRD